MKLKKQQQQLWHPQPLLINLQHIRVSKSLNLPLLNSKFTLVRVWLLNTLIPLHIDLKKKKFKNKNPNKKLLNINMMTTYLLKFMYPIIKLKTDIFPLILSKDSKKLIPRNKTKKKLNKNLSSINSMITFPLNMSSPTTQLKMDISPLILFKDSKKPKLMLHSLKKIPKLVLTHMIEPTKFLLYLPRLLIKVLLIIMSPLPKVL